ncbi:MAG: hypothetical protein AAFP02_21035, partial [Bacteroidota bacterium]
YDRPLVSALSFGHRDKQFQFSPQMFKAGADKLFLAGFNQLVYQGTSYPMPLGDGQFWHPFKKAQAPFAAQATDFGSSSVFFPHWGTLNQYVSRCQYILRQGKPVSEALVFIRFWDFRLVSHKQKVFKNGISMVTFLLGARPVLVALLLKPLGKKRLRRSQDWIGIKKLTRCLRC